MTRQAYPSLGSKHSFVYPLWFISSPQKNLGMSFFCVVISKFYFHILRAEIVNSLLRIAVEISGHRRHLALSCLILFASHVENCQVFVGTSVFHNLFFIGMEESGDVLRALLRLLSSLSVNKSTAEEQALRSDCPKLLIKILDDYGTDIALIE